jgi:hypothetical protein
MLTLQALFFEAYLLPYLVALKAINPFHQESYENTRAKAKNLGQTVKTLKFCKF